MRHGLLHAGHPFFKENDIVAWMVRMKRTMTSVGMDQLKEIVF
jgi:hypothetical protein